MAMGGVAILGHSREGEVPSRTITGGAVLLRALFWSASSRHVISLSASSQSLPSGCMPADTLAVGFWQWVEDGRRFCAWASGTTIEMGVGREYVGGTRNRRRAALHSLHYMA